MPVDIQRLERKAESLRTQSGSLGRRRRSQLEKKRRRSTRHRRRIAAPWQPLSPVVKARAKRARRNLNRIRKGLVDVKYQPPKTRKRRAKWNALKKYQPGDRRKRKAAKGDRRRRKGWFEFEQTQPALQEVAEVLTKLGL